MWLGNHRGYEHSRRHLELNTTNPEFWNYGLHELATFDLPAQFEFIHKTTNSSKVIYVGYSLSTKLLAMYSSLHPEESLKYIKSSILIGPVIMMKHVSNFFKWGLYLLKLLKVIIIIQYLIFVIQPYLRFGELWSFESVRPLLQSSTIVPFVGNSLTKLTVGWSPDGIDSVFFSYTLYNSSFLSL